jgi:hypothetical protein
MPTQFQHADAAWPLADKPEVIAVTTTSTQHTLVGSLTAHIAAADAGKLFDWVAETGDVFCVLSMPSAMGSATEAGTTPPDITFTGIPEFGGELVVEVNATSDGAIANTTFDWSIGGVSQATAVAPVDGVLTLTGSGLTCTFAAATGFNADQSWTASPNASAADNTATSGATVPFLIKAGQNPVRRALPDVSSIPTGKALVLACKCAASTATLRFWPSSGK